MIRWGRELIMVPLDCGARQWLIVLMVPGTFQILCLFVPSVFPNIYCLRSQTLLASNDSLITRK